MGCIGKESSMMMSSVVGVRGAFKTSNAMIEVSGGRLRLSADNLLAGWCS